MEYQVYGPLRGATGGKSVTAEFESGTVRDALDAFVVAHPSAERYLRESDGGYRPSVRVLIDGEHASLDEPCPPDATVTLIPAVQGGERTVR
jgi:molybdopterin synthase sulfur carrier subunit